MRRAQSRLNIRLATFFMTAAVCLWPNSNAVSTSSRMQSGLTESTTEWNHWRFFRAIERGDATQAGLVAVLVPQLIYERSLPTLADLRVVDDTGKEIPYSLVVVRTSQKTETLALHGFARSVPGRYQLQFLLDLGPNPPPHNALRIQTTATDFIGWAELAASDNGRAWSTLASRAPLFRFESRHISGKSVVAFPETRTRYLRLHIVQRAPGFPVDGVTALHTTLLPGDRMAVAARFQAAPGPTSGSVVWQTQLPAAMPLDEVDFESDAQEFSAHVEIFTANDGETWTESGEGDIYSIRREGEKQDSLTVDFAETVARFWRIAAHSTGQARNDAQPALFMTPRRVVFRREPGRSYRLIYGDSEAPPPTYELAQTAASASGQQVPFEQLGAEQVNPDWVDARPWTERQAWVLWAGLLLAGLILGDAVRRAIRPAAQQTQR